MKKFFEEYWFTILCCLSFTYAIIVFVISINRKGMEQDMDFLGIDTTIWITIIIAVITLVGIIIQSNVIMSKTFRNVEKEMNRLITEYNANQHKDLSKEHKDLSKEHKDLSKEHNDINSNIDNKYSLLSSMEIKIKGKIENLEQRTNDFYSLTKVSDRQALSTLETSITSLNAENNLLLKMKNDLADEVIQFRSINLQIQELLKEKGLEVVINDNNVSIIDVGNGQDYELER